jgi:murein DD-endopeptidase MepM/ murein hydrolase activator NlpD
MKDSKGAILAQKVTEQERKIQLRWLVAISSIPLFGMVAAFGIAPQTDATYVSVQTVTETLALPSIPQDASATAEFWREERIQRGDTVTDLLNRLHIDPQDIQTFLSSNRDTSALSQLRPGKTVQARTTAAGELISLRYIAGDGNLLQVEKQGDTFKASEKAAPLVQDVQMKSGKIASSLFAATDAADLPDAVAMQLVEIFSTDIDFHKDLRKNDQFTVVYETFHSNGEPVKSGHILAAEFTNQGKIYRAVYFQDAQGHGGYYTPDGKSLRKAFLRSPLEFSRVTSGFTNARFHPILKEWRSHKGVDYGAAIGTRVKAVADATVAFMGKQNGYGNLLVLKHQGQYSTAYGHLSGFAKGLHMGSKVSQGDVVAYVGMTGMATGPHLHYEFRIAGVQRNPLTVDMPTAFPIATQLRPQFQATSRAMLTRLDMLRGTNLASLD